MNCVTFCGRLCRQWIAVPFAATHQALEGRNIFTSEPESSSPGNGSGVTTPIAPIADTVTDGNHTEEHGGFHVSWLGTFNPEDTGIWIDSALLLVFGGIPWQVRSRRFPGGPLCGN